MLYKKVFSFASVVLLTAFTLSSIAAYYSIQGLVAIFSAAAVPIMVMGGSLEFAKVITTIWLHNYWNRAGWQIKLYLIPAVVALAFLTSMGIFGYLSKAHSDQSLVSGDVGAKVAIYDEKIKIAKDNIDANRKALQQMDSQVDQLLGRTTDDKGANRAVQVRKQQKAERTRLQNEIAADQETISKLNDEAAPIRAQVRKVEAEVGPIKYIAALIYGDNPDNNLLERAVRWVIILIVFVFDPLALMLVLAAQRSYHWLEEDMQKTTEDTFVNNFLNSKGSVDKDIDLEFNDVVHDKCGTPECCGQCDTAVDEDFLEKLNMVQSPAKDKGDVSEIIQTDVIESDDVGRQDVHEEHITDADEHVEELEHVEKPVEEVTPAPQIKTEGVTIQESDGGSHVIFNGKSISKEALIEMHPSLFAAPDSGNQSDTSFGAEFPKFAKKGDVFVRVDSLPNRVFKFDGTKWIEVNKELTDTYLYDEEYIRYLITKLSQGEYDIELLSENEREQIETYLRQN